MRSSRQIAWEYIHGDDDMHSGGRYFITDTEPGLVNKRDKPVTNHSCSSRCQRGGWNKDMGVPCLKVED